MLRQGFGLGEPQQSRTKSEVAASPLPSRGSKRGRKCYVTRAFSGIANQGEINQKWLPKPCLLGSPKEGGSAVSLLRSRGSPTKGSKIRSGCLTAAFPGAQKSGRIRYATPAFLRVPNKREKIRIGYLTTAFSGAHRWADLLRSPCILGRHRCADLLRNPCILGRRQQGGEHENRPPHLCPLRGPQVYGIAT